MVETNKLLSRVLTLIDKNGYTSASDLLGCDNLTDEEIDLALKMLINAGFLKYEDETISGIQFSRNEG